MKINLIVLYFISSIQLYAFQEIELFDLSKKNKIQTKTEFIFRNNKNLKQIEKDDRDFKKLSALSQSIILYYKEFLHANREKDQSLPRTRKLILDSDLRDMLFLDAPLERRMLYSDYMEDSTPKFLFQIDENVYSLYLYSYARDILTQPVCFKIDNGKPYLTVSNQEKHIKIRSEISSILESYKNIDIINYNIIKNSKSIDIFNHTYYIFILVIFLLLGLFFFVLKKQKKSL